MPGEIRQVQCVRTSLVAFMLIFAAHISVRAQDQEKKLIDRLLKPDMNLHNSAQNKQFVADGSSINKRASAGTFYVQQRPNQKNFAATRDVSTQQFSSKPFHSKHSIFDVFAHQRVADSRSAYANQSAGGVRDAPQSGKKIGTEQYADNRPFLDQGKGQKSLNRQNEPLTIDQVRELLNKNK